MLLPGADDLLRLDAALAAGAARAVADALDDGPGAQARAADTDWSSLAEDGCETVLRAIEQRGRAIAVELRVAAATLTRAAST